MTNAYKTAVNEYMVQRGFEDADGNVLKPFRDRVIRPGDPEYGKPDTEDAIMANADARSPASPTSTPFPLGACRPATFRLAISRLASRTI